MSFPIDKEGETKESSAPVALQRCNICLKEVSNGVFAPYCSRYELLRTFIDFETKYIQPPKKVESSVPASDMTDVSSAPASKESKKPKKLPRVSYNQYVPTMRQKSRTLLLEALRKPIQMDKDIASIDTLDLACRIEQSLYDLFPFSLNFSLKGDYNSKLRDLLFNLNDPHNPDLRQRLFDDVIEPERLPLLSADELASEEMRKWREEEERKHMEENVMLTAASEKKLTVPLEESRPKTEEKEVEKKPSPEPPEEEMPLPNAEAVAKREEQIAALLESVPASMPEPPATSAVIEEEKPLEKEEEEEEAKEEEKEEETVELPLRREKEGSIRIAMPEGEAVHFRTRVIQAPEDEELEELQLASVVRVIGRLNVSTCQTFYDSRQADPAFDVVWVLLELADDSTDASLQKLLKNFVAEKRVGVLDTGLKEKTFYFVPPALDPITTSPIATLSSVTDGCYKQFCHLLYIRRRNHVRPKPVVAPTTPPPRPRFTPHSPQSPPPRPMMMPGRPMMMPGRPMMMPGRPMMMPGRPMMGFPPRGPIGGYPRGEMMPRGDMGMMPRGEMIPRGDMGMMPRGDMGMMPRGDMGMMPRGNMMPRGDMNMIPRGEMMPRGDMGMMPREMMPRGEMMPNPDAPRMPGNVLPRYPPYPRAPFYPRSSPYPQPPQQQQQQRSRWDDRPYCSVC